jgi:hypothetical protein
MASQARPQAAKILLEPTSLQRSFSVGAARCIDVARLELVRLYDEATEAQRSDQDGWEQIQLSLRGLARQCADLQPDLVRRFSNDGLALTTENVHTVEHDALEPPSTMDLPLDMVDVGHVEDAPDNGTPQGLHAAFAERLAAVGAELAATYAAASGAERHQVGERIHARLRELHLLYAHVPQEEARDSQPSPRSHADASVGTDDVEIDAPDGRLVRRRTTVHEVLAVLDSGIASSVRVVLAPCDGPGTFDVENDVARMVCGRSAAALAIRLRWVGIVLGILGGAVPILLILAVHWASGGLGQYALAYEWALWLEVWSCVGWWLTVWVLLLWFASMQREIAWMALKQASTLWIIAMTGVFVAGNVSLYEFGVHRSTWASVPSYVECALFFPLVAMADALPPKLRLHVLRFLGPLALGAAAAVALVLRLPTAEDTPGELVWTVMGTDTVTNLQAITYSSTVMTLLLAEGVLNSWVFPNRLAFIQASWNVTECVNVAAAAQGPPAAPGSSANVAPHPLGPNSLGVKTLALPPNFVRR